MTVAEYKVRLDAFEGPLDLLLYLIRKSEVDIHDIPVAQITDQYMALIKQDAGLEHLDIELAGEFLVMAATLMELKSRLLSPLPKPAPGTEGSSDVGMAPVADELDPRADLVQKLLAYKRYRDAASMLQDRHAQWEARFPSAPAQVPQAPVEAVDADAPVEISDIDLVDLVEAFSRIMSTVDFARVGEHRVFDDETPIQIHAADLLDQLKNAPEVQQGRRVSFRSMFTGRTRSEAIGLFLALLELIRQKQVRFHQDSIQGTIELEPITGETLDGPAASAPTPA